MVMKRKPELFAKGMSGWCDNYICLTGARSIQNADFSRVFTTLKTNTIQFSNFISFIGSCKYLKLVKIHLLKITSNKPSIQVLFFALKSAYNIGY